MEQYNQTEVKITEILTRIFSKIQGNYFNSENFEMGENDLVGLIPFVLEKSGYRKEYNSVTNYFIGLSANCISNQLIREDQHSCANFESDQIVELLRYCNNEEYLELFNYYIGELEHLEYHKINDVEMFFGDKVSIPFNTLIEILAKLVLADLSEVLERIKK